MLALNVYVTKWEIVKFINDVVTSKIAKASVGFVLDDSLQMTGSKMESNLTQS